MNKVLLAFALILASVQPALAVPGDRGPQRSEDRREDRRGDRDEDRDERRSGEIIAGVIGGIIGLIAADQMDRDDRDRGPGRGGPGRGGPGGGGWDPGRGGGHGGGHGGGYPPPRRPVICYAQNLRGQIFQGRGPNAQIAQRQALEQCYSFRSRRCVPRGCQR